MRKVVSNVMPGEVTGFKEHSLGTSIKFQFYQSSQLELDLFLTQDIDDDGERGGANSQFNNNDDPEYFAYECLTIRDTEKLFLDEILALSDALKVSLALLDDLSLVRDEPS